MWNHFCSSFFVGGRKSGDKGKQYDRAGFEGNEKTVQPRCARGSWDYTISLHARENLTTSLRLKEMNLLRRMRASSPYGASSDTLKPNFVRGKHHKTSLRL